MHVIRLPCPVFLFGGQDRVKTRSPINHFELYREISSLIALQLAAP